MTKVKKISNISIKIFEVSGTTVEDFYSRHSFTTGRKVRKNDQNKKLLPEKSYNLRKLLIIQPIFWYFFFFWTSASSYNTLHVWIWPKKGICEILFSQLEIQKDDIFIYIVIKKKPPKPLNAWNTPASAELSNGRRSLSLKVLFSISLLLVFTITHIHISVFHFNWYSQSFVFISFYI